MIYGKRTLADRLSLPLYVSAKRASLLACALLLATAFTGTAQAQYRSFNGLGNNSINPTLGMAGETMPRVAPAMYADGMFTPMAGLPNPREVSNQVFNQPESIPNLSGLSDFVWLWGQFIDHDIVRTKTGALMESDPIPVPTGDPMFDPFSTGSATIPFMRTDFDPSTGNAPGNARQHVNLNTAFIDGSTLYGSSQSRADALRTFVDGKLKTSLGNMLPFNTMGLENDNESPAPANTLFVAGDPRSNEHPGLAAMHTLFVREHNLICNELAVIQPSWSDTQLYHEARRIVGAKIQAITYNEWLPLLLGNNAPSVTGTYNPTLDPGIANEFATAFFRIGHTMLPKTLLRIQPNNLPANVGHVDLMLTFFNPNFVTNTQDLEFFLKGMAARRMQNIDAKMTEGVRDFLFGPPGAGGLDLVSLNIQRGRDHGIPDYNSMRIAYGLTPAASFNDVTTNPDILAALQSLYGTISKLDAWVGALAENHMANEIMGELLNVSIATMFENLRDGDSMYYHFDPGFSPADLAILDATTLGDIIRRNTSITLLQPNVFTVIPDPVIQTEIITQATPGAFQLQVNWMTDANATYQVEESTLISGSNTWMQVTPLFNGMNAVNSFVSLNDSQNVKFFRIRQYP